MRGALLKRLRAARMELQLRQLALTSNAAIPAVMLARAAMKQAVSGRAWNEAGGACFSPDEKVS